MDDNNIVFLPLTKGAVAIIDAEDYDRVKHWKWFITSRGYAGRWITVHADGKAKKRLVHLHRFILSEEGMITDHINGNKLDNRKANLRICSNTENIRNMKQRRRNNTSGYKGVSWSKKLGAYRAYIVVDRRQISLGFHKCPKQAALAYNLAALKYYGEFARLNQVELDEEDQLKYEALCKLVLA